MHSCLFTAVILVGLLELWCGGEEGSRMMCAQMCKQPVQLGAAYLQGGTEGCHPQAASCHRADCLRTKSLVISTLGWS